MVAGMVMPLDNLKAIYEHLFRDGVMVAKKDKRPQTKHPEIPGVQNLQVIRAMGSLKSRGYVTETFAWRHFYWYLTNEGIVYLRDYLRLPPEIVPTPLQRVRRPVATLTITRRADRVQAIQDPTSYVPKPGKMGAERQEALLDRQGYRRKTTSTDEAEVIESTEKTPRFRGRPMASSQIKYKGSWESKEQPMFSDNRDYTKEMEPSVRRKVTMPSGSHMLSFETHHAKPVEKEKMVERREGTAFVQKIQKVNMVPGVPTVSSTAVESTLFSVHNEAVKEKPKEVVSIKVSHETKSTATGDSKTAKDDRLHTPSKLKVEKTQKTLVMKNMQDMPTVSSAEKTIAVDSSVFSVHTEVVKEKPKEQTYIKVSQQITSTVTDNSKTAKDVPRPSASKSKVEKTQKPIVFKNLQDVSSSADKSSVSSIPAEAAKEKPKEEMFIKVSETKDVFLPVPSKPKVEKAQQSVVTKKVQNVPAVSTATETTAVKPSVFSVSTEATKEKSKEEVCVNVSQETTSKSERKMDKDAPLPAPSKPKVDKVEKTKNVQEIPTVLSAVVTTADKEKPKEEVCINVSQETILLSKNILRPAVSKLTAEETQKTLVTKNVQDVTPVSSVVETNPVKCSVPSVSTETVKEKPKEEVCDVASQETTSTGDSKTDKDASYPASSKPKVAKTEKTNKTKSVQEISTVLSTLETTVVKSSMFSVSTEADKERPKEEVCIIVSQKASSKDDCKTDKDVPHPTLPKPKVEKTQKILVTKNVPDGTTVSSEVEMVAEKSSVSVRAIVPQETSAIGDNKSETPSKLKVGKMQKKAKNVQDLPAVSSPLETTALESSVCSVTAEAVKEKPEEGAFINISQETTFTGTDDGKIDKDAPRPTPSKQKADKMQKMSMTKNVQEKTIKDKTADITNETSVTSISPQVPVKTLVSAVSPLPKKEEHLENKSEINLPLHTSEISVEESVRKSAFTAVPPSVSSTVQVIDKQHKVLASQKPKEVQEASQDDNTIPLKVHGKVEIPCAISTSEVKAEVKGLSPKSQSPSMGVEVKITTADSSKTSEVVAQTPKKFVETPKQIDSVQQRSAPAKLTEEPVVTGEAKTIKDKDTEEASKPSKGKKKKKSANKTSALKQVPQLIPDTKVTEVRMIAQDSGQVDLLKTEDPGQVATNDSAKTSPEGMRTVESMQPTAVQREAPAHKGEVELAQPLTEKREVLKGKSSSSQRQWEAPAASASAAASAQLTPLPEQGEPPSIAQPTAAPDTQQSAEKQNRLSDSKAPAQPVITGPLPADENTCDGQTQSTNDAMRKKIVVVEEVIEVQQAVSPVEGQTTAPPLPEVSGDDLDYDVLEELAVERGLLQSPTEETFWDHSLQEPEEKTFPNFIEGTSPF